MTYVSIIFIGLFSFISYYLCYRIGKAFNLIDKPTERKIHKKKIPNTGGIGFFFSLIFAVWILFFNINFLNIIFAGFFILIIGVLDDKYQINPSIRLLIQSIFIFYFLNEYDLNIPYLFLTNDFKLSLGGFSIIFSILSILLLIHSSNYCDGIDGLLVLISILSFMTIYLLQLYFYANGDFEILIIILVLMIFLVFNFNLASFPKIFLGDGGSNLLGFILGLVTINSSYYSNFPISPLLLIWPLSYLVFEFLTTNLIRATHNKGIFTAGDDHLHYLLLKKYKSILKVNSIIIGISFLLICLGIISWLINPIFSIVNFILCFLAYIYFRRKLV